jgi:hypothetical protein
VIRIFICSFLICSNFIASAQLYDAQWLLGYNESIVDFRTADTVKLDSLPTLIYFILTNACICDEQGNLLYYTNGIDICGQTDTLMNGTGLSPCAYTDVYANNGLNIPQAALFIPKPGNSRYYYLFHFSNDTLGDARPSTLYFSLIDKEGNGGKGDVVTKNNSFFKGNILRGGGMTACKHANGRDYWLIMGASDTSIFYKFLITPDSILGPYIQNIGPSFPLPNDIAYSKFSQDGSKFATGTYESPVLVMDFDRCSGEFSNVLTILNNWIPPFAIVSGSCSVEFSPNNRFLYVCNNINLNQYDLWATNKQDSIQLFLQNGGAQMGYLQEAPNGKIYASTWNGGLPALHVINYPDQKGDSAGFVFGGQPTLTINSINVPNLINYKLGPLMGSGCDTITAITGVSTNSQEPKIMPNPANKYAYVEIGMQGNYEFDLLNTNGQVVDKKETPQIDIFDTEHIAAGSYFIRVIDKITGNEVATKKVAVVH